MDSLKRESALGRQEPKSLRARAREGAVEGEPGRFFLGEDLVEDMTVDIGETPVAAVVSKAEARVVDAQQVQEGGVDVVDFRGFFRSRGL